MENQPTPILPPCHCGKPSNDYGNGIEYICEPCFMAWERAGEPESCPCTVLTCLGCDGSGTRVKWNNGRGRISIINCPVCKGSGKRTVN